MEKKDIDHKELRDGPIKHRSCTDILCALLFFAFVGSMIALGVFGYQNGDPDILIYPYDSEGNQCGRPDTKTADYPYLYYTDGIEFSDFKYTVNTEAKYKVCVKQCLPNIENIEYNCYPNSFVWKCDYTVIQRDTDANETVHYDPYNSTDYFERFCVPSVVSDSFKEYLGSNSVMSFGTDIVRTWKIVFAVLGIAVVISVLYLLLLRYFIGAIVWIVIILIIAVLVLFGVYFQLKVSDVDSSSQDYYLYWGLAIIAYGTALAFIIVVFCLRKRIELAVAVMKSATIFIEDLWSILLVPIVMFAICVGIFAFWVLALVYLYTSGTLEESSANYKALARIQFDDSLKNAMWFELLGIFWINSFQIALLEFIISFACCVWYFSQDKNDLHHPIWRGVKNGLWYHIGSLAFGSLILALVILIKWAIQILSKAYSERPDANAVVSCFCKCAACCVNCFERFIKFLNNQAYIRIALTGEGFCSAAQSAFEMIWENAGRFAALGGVSGVFNFLGKLLITTSSTYLGFLIIDEYYANKISSPVGPIVLFVILSYLVSSLFMSVYEIAADTIIQAFIVDEKLNGKGKANFAPEPIKEFMDEQGKD